MVFPVMNERARGPSDFKWPETQGHLLNSQLACFTSDCSFREISVAFLDVAPLTIRWTAVECARTHFEQGDSLRH